MDSVYKEKKEYIWLSHMIKAPIPTEIPKKWSETKTHPKSSITKRV